MLIQTKTEITTDFGMTTLLEAKEIAEVVAIMPNNNGSEPRLELHCKRFAGDVVKVVLTKEYLDEHISMLSEHTTPVVSNADQLAVFAPTVNAWFGMAV